MSIKFGCHGSTWELDYDKESDRLDSILAVISRAGFRGIDAQISLLGQYRQSPERLKQTLDLHGLHLAALTVPFSWLGDEESDWEKQLGDNFIAYLKHFPGALMNVAPRVGANRNGLLRRQKQIVACANALAQRASRAGVVCSFHPSSPATSYFRTEDDYRTLFDLLDRRYIGWTPDAGHIACGGMDVLAIVARYADFIRHVHIKDADRSGSWRTMGKGDIPFPDLVSFLAGRGYQGWIMVEEETPESSANPDNAVLNIARYVAEWLQPAARVPGE